MLILTILLFILIFGLIIFLHELGHFLVAKREGMTVKEFAFGFPPRLWSATKHGTKFSLNLVPVGGYVSILGEEEASDAKGSFTKFSPWARLRVIVAGVAMNVLLAWVLFTIWLWLAPLAPKIDAIVVAAVQPGSVAEQVGIRPNDLIVSATPADGSETTTRFQSDVALREYTKSHRNQATNFVIRRSGTELAVPATLGSGEVSLGVSITDVGNKIPNVPWWKAPKEALVEMWAIVVMTFTLMAKLIWWPIMKLFVFLAGIVGITVPTPSDQTQLLQSVSGPIGIFTGLRQSVSLGVPFVVYLAGFLSLSVGIFNILPIPALDGGRAAFILYEAITGKKVVSHQIESWIHAIGFAILILLILIVTFFDIKKL